MREFWFQDRRELSAIAEEIEREFDVQLEHDMENRYEWFAGENRSGKFNLSRDHSRSRTAATNPVRLSLSGQGTAVIDELGRRLARCLAVPIQFGEVTYLGGENFHFDVITSYAPGE